MDERKIATLAAEIGAKAALNKLDSEREKRRAAYTQSVRQLLGNYTTLKNFVDSAVYEASYTADRVSYDDLMRELMTPDRDVDVVVESIQRSAQRTKAVYLHINSMLDAYRRRCTAPDAAQTAKRRWRIIDAVFIHREWQAVDKIARKENISERVVYQDIQTACEELAPFFFGVDAL